jgi:DNA polymerase-3 subunit gamma/tau
MSYKALYRTYRPQKFSEVIGQDHIVRTLQNALVNNKISHAYLFTGPRGTGKTSVARIFAKALNCTNSNGGEPCGECTSCKEIADSNSPDVVEIDAASNNGVDEIRDIRDKVKFLPAGSKYKIYIIDEVHMLTQGAFNALLKTLEEPPKHAIFVLATTEPHKVIPTIISRCQRFDFKALSVNEIASLIKKVAQEEKFQISEEAIVAISEGAEGGMRDALSYLDQAASFADGEITIDDVNSVTGNLNYDKIIQLATCFENKDINRALKTISDLIMMGKEVNKVVSGMLQFYRDVLLYKNTDTSMFSKYIYEKEEFKNLVSRINSQQIFTYVDILSEVQTRIKTSSTPAIHLDIAVIKIINGFQTDDLMRRLSVLEEMVSKGGTTGNGVGAQQIAILEDKVGRIINELNRLELPTLIDKVQKLESNSSVGFDTTLHALKTQVLDLQKDIQGKSEIKGQTPEDFTIQLEKVVDEKIKELSIEGKEDTSLLELEEKVLFLENEMKTLKESYSKPKVTKIKRKRVNEGQMVFFGDEVVALKELEQDLAEEDVVQEEQEQSPIEEEQEQVLVEEIEQEDKKTDFINKDESKVIKLSDFEEHTVEEQKVVAEPAQSTNLHVQAKEEVKENQHSHLVRRINPISDAVEAKTIIPEKPVVEVEKPKVVEVVEEKDPLQNLFDDEISRFDVAVLERVLHSSRSATAREDKIRIVNLWKTLVRNCSPSFIPIAEILQEGQIVAVGEKEFIIVYPDTILCNQVMSISFKRKSLKLLYDFLGDTYNYMALPEEIWIEKRTEYINQYNIGIKYPKLTPINNPDLVVEPEKTSISARDKLVNETIRILGEDIVKIE